MLLLLPHALAAPEPACPLDDFALDIPVHCVEGDVVDVAVRDVDGQVLPEACAVMWSSDVGEFADSGVAETTWTCPDVACPSQTVNIYVVVLDEDSDQEWVFGKIGVACAEEADDTGVPDGEECGCGTGTAAGGWAGLVALASLVRRAQRGGGAEGYT